MAPLPLHWQSIQALSEQIHSGELSPVDLVDHFLARIEALAPTLQAYIRVDPSGPAPAPGQPRHSGFGLYQEDARPVPTTMMPAPPVDRVDASREAYTTHNLQDLCNTAIGNILNLCAVPVPCGFTASGPPVGLMVYGRPCQEDTVLRLAHAYEQATEWHRRTPALGWAGSPR